MSEFLISPDIFAFAQITQPPATLTQQRDTSIVMKLFYLQFCTPLHFFFLLFKSLESPWGKSIHKLPFSQWTFFCRMIRLDLSNWHTYFSALRDCSNFENFPTVNCFFHIFFLSPPLLFCARDCKSCSKTLHKSLFNILIMQFSFTSLHTRQSWKHSRHSAERPDTLDESKISLWCDSIRWAEAFVQIWKIYRSYLGESCLVVPKLLWI